MSTKIKTAFNLFFLLVTIFALCISPIAFVRSYDQMDKMDWSMGVVSWLALALYTIYFCRKLLKERANRA